LNPDPRTVIPHRPPLLCIDRITKADGQGAFTERSVGEGPHAAGGELWEGALIEGLTQTAAVLLDADIRQRGGRPGKGVLAGIRGLRIDRRPRQGETVRYAVTIIRIIFPLALVGCEALCGEEVVAAGEMKFHVEILP
jgi:predicted hotdog family 3-hydroxylacyl-ACP dehydratase